MGGISKKTLEELEGEITRLQEQLQNARDKEAEATKALEDLSPRRREISVAVLEENPKAEAELKSLARQRAELEMEVEAAQDAASRLEEMLKEAKERRDEEHKRLAKEEHGRLSAESAKLQKEADALLEKYWQKKLEARRLYWNAYRAASKAGIRMSPTVQEVADETHGRLRSWELHHNAVVS